MRAVEDFVHAHAAQAAATDARFAAEVDVQQSRAIAAVRCAHALLRGAARRLCVSEEADEDWSAEEFASEGAAKTSLL